MSSPHILAVSSLSNSTALHALLYALDTTSSTGSTRRTCRLVCRVVSRRDVTWRGKWNLGLCFCCRIEEVAHAAGEPGTGCADYEHFARLWRRLGTRHAAKGTRLPSCRSPPNACFAETVRIHSPKSTRLDVLTFMLLKYGFVVDIMTKAVINK